MRVIADDEIVAAVRAVLPEVEAVYLFGSHATPYQTEESDLDLAIVHPGRLSGLQMWQAGAALSETLAITVDLLDLWRVAARSHNRNMRDPSPSHGGDVVMGTRSIAGRV